MNDNAALRPRLEVCVVTFGKQGADRLTAMQLPRLPGVAYLVSWQERGKTRVPAELAAREDVRILDLNGLGSSRNRNNCLDNARGEIVLFADDDVTLYPDGLVRVIEEFARRPEMDYGSFRYDSDVAKEYPAEACSLNGRRLPKNFYQSAIEIALRMDSPAGRLRFSEDFGFGVKEFKAGEDSLMLLRARRRGVRAQFVPLTVAYHPGAGTGESARLSRGAMIVDGVVAVVQYPATAILRIPLKAWRIARNNQASFFRSLRLQIRGAIKEIFGRKAARYLNAPL